MARSRALILRTPGTNCDGETVFAFQQVGAVVSLVHINQLIRGEKRLADYQIMVIPGGFTFRISATASLNSGGLSDIDFPALGYFLFLLFFSPALCVIQNPTKYLTPDVPEDKQVSDWGNGVMKKITFQKV